MIRDAIPFSNSFCLARFRISLIILFLSFSITSFAQYKSSEVFTHISARRVSVNRKSTVSKNKVQFSSAQKSIHFNLNKNLILQLKTQKILSGASGGNAIKDLYKTTQSKLNSKNNSYKKILSPTMNYSFDGISQFSDSIPWYPPDPMIAAGNNEIIQTVNDEFAVYDTSGSIMYKETFAQLFGYPANSYIFDPKVIYDKSSGRFVMLILMTDYSTGTSSYLIAASDNPSDPGGSFWLYTLDASSDGANPTNNFADFPGLGVDSSSLFITSNQYDFSTGNFQYAKLRVMSKDSIYAGANFNYTDFWAMQNADGSNVFTLKPALTLGNSNTEYLMNTDPDGNNYVTTWTVNFSVGVPSLKLASTVNIGAYQVPPDAPQLGSTSLIATGDCRTQEVVWQNNELYTAFTEGYNWGSGVVDALRILKINTTTWTADQNVNYGSDNVSYFYPAVTPDSTGKMYLVFNTSSSEQNVSMRSAAEVWNDPSSTLLGEGYYSYNPGRWGDYSGISLSPSGTVWAVAELPDFQDYWYTHISSLTSPTGPTNSYIVLSDSTVDFIGTTVGKASTFILDMQNPSYASGNLVGSVSVQNSHFSIQSGSSFNLSPGQYIKIVIQCNAAAPGYLSDSLIINNNASNYPSVLKLGMKAYAVNLLSKPKRILFDFFNDYYGSSDSLYFGNLIRLLRAQGNIVVTNDTTFDLRGYDYYVSVTPNQDYTSQQISALQSFVNAGGGLIVLPYYNYYPGSQFQNNLLSSNGWGAGISINNNLVQDTTQEIGFDPNWINLTNFPHAADPLFSNVSTLGAFHASSLNISSPADSIIITSPYAYDFYLKLNDLGGKYARLSETSNSSNQVNAIASASGQGSIPVAAEVNEGAGKVITLGTEEFFAEPSYSPGDTYSNPYYFPGIRYGDNRIFALNMFDTQVGPPVVKIVSVSDVPNDNGKQVRVTWKNEFADGPSPIIGYAIWRYDSSWTFISPIPVSNDSTYSMNVPTLADSGSSGNHYAIFRVTAYTNNRVFASLADSGYSVNNLMITSVPAPAITSIKDVPNDQGHEVYLSWKVNTPAVTSGISNFDVWRKDSVWVYIKEITATSDSSYTTIVPTIFDSTIANGMHFSTFKVSSHSSDPAIFAMSSPDSGYSLDNLRPQAPDSLQALISQSSIVLNWSKPVDKDFKYFEIYRDSVANVNLSQLKPIAFATINTYSDTKVVLGKSYYYWVAAVDFSGNQSIISAPINITITDVAQEKLIPKNYALFQNYPNPFNPTTIISYDLPKSSAVKLVVFDILGREVATLVNDFQSAGSHKAEWNGKNGNGIDLTSGIYFYSLQAGSFKSVKKMIYLK